MYPETNEITNQVILHSRGIKLTSTESHDNVFIAKLVTDTSNYGNVGLYSTFHSSSWYGHALMYNVPLARIHTGEMSATDKYLISMWKKFCKGRDIRKYKNWPNVAMTTKVNLANEKGSIKDFFEFLKQSEPDSYVNEKGQTVFTENYLTKRGKCCKNSCIHCPY